MKKLTLIALALLSTGAALAQGLSREQVVAELQRARAAGELERAEAESYGPQQPVAAGSKTRAQVVAELRQARASGELARLNLNQSGYAHLLPLQPEGRAAGPLLAGQPVNAR